MATIYNFDGFRFFFYSNEGNEPPHIHVSNNEGELKVWLNSLTIERWYGLRTSERNIIIKIVRNNQKRFLQEWMKFYE